LDFAKPWRLKENAKEKSRTKIMKTKGTQVLEALNVFRDPDDKTTKIESGSGIPCETIVWCASFNGKHF
jgi:hypothetical protein